jgi:opacity protein-like surface antigen
MRAGSLVLVLVACSCASPASPSGPQSSPAEPSASRFDVLLGLRALDKDDWDPVEHQGALGLQYVHEKPTDWIGFELGLSGSNGLKQDESIGGNVADVRGRTTELSAGIRKTFSRQPGQASPYVGAGVSWIRAEIREEFPISTTEDHDSSGGVYVHGGVDFPLGPALSLGFDLRALGGTKIELFGASGTADYVQLALVLGVHF